MEKKPSFMNVPVGANKRYIVMGSGEPFAGFDKLSQANAYVTMQKNKKKGGTAAPANSANKTWEVKDTKA